MKTYRIIRNDGRWIPQYDFETRAEAEQTIKEMAEPDRSPFTYRIREVNDDETNDPV